MPRNLTIQESHEFLDSKPGWIALTTIGPDGYPHTVPLGYFRLGEDIVMGVRGNTRKLKNIQDNPKVSLLLEIEPMLFMKQCIPGSGLAMFPRSGHAINLEEPALFNSTVPDFLTAVEAEAWATSG
jgi:pimeloyl-ACP methyl ester carboxylesterase